MGWVLYRHLVRLAFRVKSYKDWMSGLESAWGGAVDAWPSNIIQNIFEPCAHPYDVHSTMVAVVVSYKLPPSLVTLSPF